MRANTLFLCLILSGTLGAQDTLTLRGCHLLAVENAPRLKDREFIRQIGQLKVDNASTHWYPSLELNGKLSYQSDVVTVAIAEPTLPLEFPEVPHDQYGLNLDISQTLYDGGITRQMKQFEAASSAADLQQVEVDLYGLKSKVNQFYFAILQLQENRKTVEIHMDNLYKRHAVMKAAIEQGTILEADLKVMDVEILKAEQSLLEIDTQKKALIDALAILCGDEFQQEVHLTYPALQKYMYREGKRPEYQWFELKNASMEAGKELIGKRRMPVLFAFGQTGYGKPGYNMLNNEWDFYYLVGAGLKWQIWDWNSNQRDRQVIVNQQKILQNQWASFDNELASMLVQEKAKMERFEEAMELEQQVLNLQQEISEHAAAKLANGTITVTDYITELNKERIARINLAKYEVQLLQSKANYLTLQGNL